jgi:hypothetical protein
LQGNWGDFLGTPIAPNYFLTAAHVGGSVGSPITFTAGPDAGTYTTSASYTSPSSDLKIWKIDGAFSSWVPLMNGAASRGDIYTAFGRGTERGALYEFPTGTARGWLWGASTGVKRWGTGSLEGELTSGATYLYDLFDGPGTIQLSVGDSGGALFIFKDGAWRLAGIHYDVTGPYSESVGGSAFNAALYNSSILYTVNGSNYEPAPAHGAFFSTSVYADSAWINSVIVPEPPGTFLCGLALLLLLLVRKHNPTVRGNPDGLLYGGASTGTLRRSRPSTPRSTSANTGSCARSFRRSSESSWAAGISPRGSPACAANTASTSTCWRSPARGGGSARCATRTHQKGLGSRSAAVPALPETPPEKR